MQSARFAIMIAAIFGITASFAGSRYYVFKKHQKSIAHQAILFVLLYASIACMHGLILYSWTDIHGHDYRAGFVLATVMQIVLSYLGNKTLVFNK